MLQAVYPDHFVVTRSLSSVPLLTADAAAIDFVIHMSCDNLPTVCEIIHGLASFSTTRKTLPRTIMISSRVAQSTSHFL